MGYYYYPLLAPSSGFRLGCDNQKVLLLFVFVVECIFLHEEIEKCRFGDSCERDLCMYQHGMKVSDEEVIDIVSEVEDAVEDEKCEEQGNTNNKNDETFMNPT